MSKPNQLNTVTVKFRNPEFNYQTSVAATATEKTCTEYFVGKFFNLASYPNENFQQCIGIEFINNNVLVNA